MWLTFGVDNLSEWTGRGPGEHIQVRVLAESGNAFPNRGLVRMFSMLVLGVLVIFPPVGLTALARVCSMDHCGVRRGEDDVESFAPALARRLDSRR